MLNIDACIDETEVDRVKLKHFEDQIISHIKPQVMNPYDYKCAITRFENMFENMSSIIQENWAVDMDKITEFEFYSKARYLSSKHQAINGNK